MGAVLALGMLLLACDSTAPEAPTAGRAEPESTPDGKPVPAESGGEVLSEGGHYRVSLRPEGGRVPRGAMHAWIVEVETAGGRPFRPSRLAFTGGMPQHQHGFITSPRVTRALGEARFLVEGVKFHMGGRWTLEVELVGPDGPDVAVLDVQVAP